MRQETRWPAAGVGVSRTSWIEWPEGCTKSKRVEWWTERAHACSLHQQELAADFPRTAWGDIAAHAARNSSDPISNTWSMRTKKGSLGAARRTAVGLLAARGIGKLLMF